MRSVTSHGIRGALGLATALLVALLAACGGEDDTDHGLSSTPLESQPRGEPIEVRYDVADGETRLARIQIAMHVWQRNRGGVREGEQRGEGTAILTLRQTFERTAANRTLRSRVRMQYVEAEGTNAESFRDREPIVGTLEHDEEGRPRPRSLRVEGGTLAQQVEALDLIGMLMFAGLGGSPPWLPPRAIREGEAWRLESYMKPRSLDSVVQEAARLGATAPKPSFSGTARLVNVETTPRGPVLEVVLDALIEIDGPLSREGLAGDMSIGNRFRGRARIEARTGLPLSFQVTHTGSKDIRSGGEHIRQEFTSEVQGTVTQGE